MSDKEPKKSKTPMTPEDADRIEEANKDKKDDDGFPKRAREAADKNVKDGKVKGEGGK